MLDIRCLSQLLLAVLYSTKVACMWPLYLSISVKLCAVWIVLTESGVVCVMNSVIISTCQCHIYGKIIFAKVFSSKEQINKVCEHVFLTATCIHTASVRSLRTIWLRFEGRTQLLVEYCGCAKQPVQRYAFTPYGKRNRNANENFRRDGQQTWWHGVQQRRVCNSVLSHCRVHCLDSTKHTNDTY